MVGKTLNDLKAGKGWKNCLHAIKVKFMRLYCTFNRNWQQGGSIDSLCCGSTRTDSWDRLSPLQLLINLSIDLKHRTQFGISRVRDQRLNSELRINLRALSWFIVVSAEFIYLKDQHIKTLKGEIVSQSLLEERIASFVVVILSFMLGKGH